MLRVKIIQMMCGTSRMADAEKDLLIAALNSQVALFKCEMINHRIPKPRPEPAFRMLWVSLSEYLPDWEKYLAVFKPETIIRWRDRRFKSFWKRKSRKVGRPPISLKAIKLIRDIHNDNPFWSPEKIYEQLVILGVIDAPAPNTIKKYIKDKRKPPSEKQSQSWAAFMKNHMKEIWSIDFFTVVTLRFKILYVFVVVSHGRRKIEHFGVTESSNLFWTIQQVREATAYDNYPKYLIHDNYPTFASERFKTFLSNSNITSVRTSFQAPNMNAICERTIGTLRRDLLRHIIPINEKHLYRLLSEYINDYYNTNRTHQGINCQTPVMPDAKPPLTTMENTKLLAKPVLGGLYHTYKKVA
jgi:transposase InsO family protein